MPSLTLLVTQQTDCTFGYYAHYRFGRDGANDNSILAVIAGGQWK